MLCETFGVECVVWWVGLLVLVWCKEVCCEAGLSWLLVAGQYAWVWMEGVTATVERTWERTLPARGLGPPRLPAKQPPQLRKASPPQHHPLYVYTLCGGCIEGWNQWSSPEASGLGCPSSRWQFDGWRLVMDWWIAPGDGSVRWWLLGIRIYI